MPDGRVGIDVFIRSSFDLDAVDERDRQALRGMLAQATDDADDDIDEMIEDGEDPMAVIGRRVQGLAEQVRHSLARGHSFRFAVRYAWHQWMEYGASEDGIIDLALRDVAEMDAGICALDEDIQAIILNASLPELAADRYRHHLSLGDRIPGHQEALKKACAFERLYEKALAHGREPGWALRYAIALEDGRSTDDYGALYANAHTWAEPVYGDELAEHFASQFADRAADIGVDDPDSWSDDDVVLMEWLRSLTETLCVHRFGIKDPAIVQRIIIAMMNTDEPTLGQGDPPDIYSPTLQTIIRAVTAG